MSPWAVQSFAFGSLLTAAKMETQYANAQLLRQNILNTLTETGTLDLTQSPVINEITQMFFQSGTGLGIDLNGRTINMGGGVLDMENGTIINEGVSGLPSVIAGGLTTATAPTVGQLVDTNTSFDFSTELTAGENFITLNNTSNMLCYRVNSIIDADTVLLGYNDAAEYGQAIKAGTGYSVYNNLHNLNWEVVAEGTAQFVNYTHSSNQVDKFGKFEVGSSAQNTNVVFAGEIHTFEIDYIPNEPGDLLFKIQTTSTASFSSDVFNPVKRYSVSQTVS